jgi:hypothetical protein
MKLRIPSPIPLKIPAQLSKLHSLAPFSAIPKGFFKALTLVVLAVLIGFYANSMTEKEAILRWERLYAPPERTVKYAFGSHHLVGLSTRASSERSAKAPSSRKLQEVLRSLPGSLTTHLDDPPAHFWASTDANWALHYSDSASSVDPQVYCADCTQAIPKQWTPMGYGWPGLTQCLEHLENHSKTKTDFSPTDSIFKRSMPMQKYQDPREIVY